MQLIQGIIMFLKQKKVTSKTCQTTTAQLKPELGNLHVLYCVYVLTTGFCVVFQTVTVSCRSPGGDRGFRLDSDGSL